MEDNAVSITRLFTTTADRLLVLLHPHQLKTGIFACVFSFVLSISFHWHNLNVSCSKAMWALWCLSHHWLESVVRQPCVWFIYFRKRKSSRSHGCTRRAMAGICRKTLRSSWSGPYTPVRDRAHSTSPCAHSTSPCAHSTNPCAHSTSPCAHGTSPCAHSTSPCAHGTSYKPLCSSPCVLAHVTTVLDEY